MGETPWKFESSRPHHTYSPWEMIPRALSFALRDLLGPPATALPGGQFGTTRFAQLMVAFRLIITECG